MNGNLTTVGNAVAFSLVLAPAHWSLAHTSQDGPEPAPRTYETLFDPSAQRTLSDSSDTLRLVSSEACESCEAGRRIRFEVDDEFTGRSLSFYLENATAQVDEIHIASSGKLGWVIGRAQSNVSVINIVNLATRSVVDSIFAYKPAISPKKRWAAYVKMYPLRSRFLTSDQYLIYDITKPPEFHRIEGVNLANRVDVGVPVHPGDIVNEPGSNLGVRPQDAHLMRAPSFFWLSEDQYAFADEWDGTYNIVAVDLSGDVQVHTHPLPIRGYTREWCRRPPADTRASPLSIRNIHRVENEEADLMVAVTVGSTRLGCVAQPDPVKVKLR